ncbi:MAG TPA: efflux transporter outer membrane subunit [Vicinamibacterales bacterium]|nr:efflux transporter outer membrane subunit [Vicinamibacterales bacterium]
MLRFMRVPFVLIAGAVVTSCTLGRDYSRPAVETPSTHRFASADATAASLADLQWFELFRDETLTGLVKTALQQNFELRIAAERVLQARAAFGITRADQFPAVAASADLTAARSSRRGAGAVPAGTDTDVSYTQAGFSLGWELDVWGRLRRLSEAARAQYLATEEARRGVITTLVADVSETYLALRALDLELEIARRTRDVATDSLRLTEARRTSGVASGLDVRQAEQLLFTATGQIASIEREIAQAENALRLLLGQTPGDVPRGRPLEAFQAPPAVPAGLPSALLERRPDIRRAEQELVAANAQIGAIKAEYFPRISLTGFFGAQSRALSDLLSAPARLASASVGAAVPVFNAGRTRGNVKLAEAVHREALVNYERVIYTAFRDVSDGLAAYAKTSEQRTQQERLVEALSESTRLATQRYEGGLDSYLPVLDAQRNLFQGELELARLRQRELASIVQLYRALGGGWSDGARS